MMMFATSFRKLYMPFFAFVSKHVIDKLPPNVIELFSEPQSG